MVNTVTGKRERTPKKLVSTGAGVVSDYAPYYSVATGQWIDGRKARREEMARAGMRELDPSEVKDVDRHTNEFRRSQEELARDPHVSFERR